MKLGPGKLNSPFPKVSGWLELLQDSNGKLYLRYYLITLKLKKLTDDRIHRHHSSGDFFSCWATIKIKKIAFEPLSSFLTLIGTIEIRCIQPPPKNRGWSEFAVRAVFSTRRQLLHNLRESSHLWTSNQNRSVKIPSVLSITPLVRSNSLTVKGQTVWPLKVKQFDLKCWV